MKKIRINGVEVAVKGSLMGGRPVLLAVHGAGGGAWIWKDIRAELSESADLLAVDLPGHGSSDGEGAVRVDVYRDVVREVARDMGIKPVAMGHSMGGAIVLDWAMSHPEELEGIVLMSTGAKLRVHPLVFQTLEHDIAAYLGLMEKMAFGPKVDKELVELAQQAFFQVKPEIIAGDFRACDAFDAMGALEDIRLPVLVLCGSEDKLTPPKYSEFLADKIDGATLKVFSGAGHVLPIERPENSADFIRRFIVKVNDEG